MSESSEHKQPKSPDAIRDKIQSMRSSYQSDAPQGDCLYGLHAADRIHVASFYNSRVCAQYQRALSAAGIMSSTELRNRQTHVRVYYEDRDRAIEILADYRGIDKRPKGLRRDFEGLLLGVILGSTIAMVVLFDSQRRAVLLPYAASWALIGGLLGHFADRVRSVWREYGRIRLGIREYLLLTVICAVAVWIPFYAARVFNL